MSKIMLFDMDGVLAVYNKSDYLREPMLHEIEGYHYFLTRPEIQLGLACYRMAKASGYVTGVLSRISEGNIGKQQTYDKMKWLRKHGIIDNIIITAGSKVDAACDYFDIKTLNTNMLLVDDFNENLTEWSNAGGTAVKFLNGKNDPASYAGPTIRFPKDVTQLK